MPEAAKVRKIVPAFEWSGTDPDLRRRHVLLTFMLTRPLSTLEGRLFLQQQGQPLPGGSHEFGIAARGGTENPASVTVYVRPDEPLDEVVAALNATLQDDADKAERLEASNEQVKEGVAGAIARTNAKLHG